MRGIPKLSADTYRLGQNSRHTKRVAGPTRLSHLGYAFTASLVQVPKRYATATLRNRAQNRPIFLTRAECSERPSVVFENYSV